MIRRPQILNRPFLIQTIGALVRKCSWLAVLAAAALLGPRAASSAIWNAAADYDAGWVAATNPNGAWSYGWSSSLTSPLNLYTRNFADPPYPTLFPDFRFWIDPAHQGPSVYKNAGPLYPLNQNTIEVPSGALILHGGGPTGNDYSHVVWTAASDGNYSLDATFTGRQTPTGGGYRVFVHVLKNGSLLHQGFLNDLGQSSSYNSVLALASGDKIDFAVGITGTGLHGETTQLEATISNASAVPEPSSLLMFATCGLATLIVARRRRPLATWIATRPRRQLMHAAVALLVAGALAALPRVGEAALGAGQGFARIQAGLNHSLQAIQLEGPAGSLELVFPERTFGNPNQLPFATFSADAVQAYDSPTAFTLKPSAEFTFQGMLGSSAFFQYSSTQTVFHTWAPAREPRTQRPGGIH